MKEAGSKHRIVFRWLWSILFIWFAIFLFSTEITDDEFADTFWAYCLPNHSRNVRMITEKTITMHAIRIENAT